jgi:hypothetical protein
VILLKAFLWCCCRSRAGVAASVAERTLPHKLLQAMCGKALFLRQESSGCTHLNLVVGRPVQWFSPHSCSLPPCMAEIDIAATTQIHSAFGRSFRVAYLGEHHQGAEHVCILLDEPFDGVSQFHSTNGFAQFSASSPHLIVYDATVIVLLDYSSSQSYHIVPPRHCYFTKQSIAAGCIDSEFYGSRSCGRFEPIALTVAADRMRLGLGPAAGGLMPSVHKPYLTWLSRPVDPQVNSLNRFSRGLGLLLMVIVVGILALAIMGDGP